VGISEPTTHIGVVGGIKSGYFWKNRNLTNTYKCSSGDRKWVFPNQQLLYELLVESKVLFFEVWKDKIGVKRQLAFYLGIKSAVF
jgi:hypothetical protein